MNNRPDRVPPKHLPSLPIERALKAISGRWKILILHYLLGGSKRLTDLQRLLPHASQKVLIQQLREMQSHGLVRREVFAEVPARVEYSATTLGRSLEPVMLMLCEWGQHHAAALGELERTAACIVRPTNA